VLQTRNVNICGGFARIIIQQNYIEYIDRKTELELHIIKIQEK